MKRVPQFILIGILSLVLTSNAYGQRSSKKDTEFKQKLWYGGSLGLGYQSFFGQSTFLFALYPMVGYKINETFSFGPRVGAAYRNIRINNGPNNIQKFNPIEFSGALFGRAKVFNQFFGHVEYELANEKRPVSGSSRLSTRTDTNFYLGAGYTSGGKLSSEIYVLYNFIEDDTSFESPFVIRGGLTYNF